MAVVKINLSCELSEAVKVQYLHGNLFSQDNQANVINVAVFEDGEPVELAGTVTANVIRPDGGTVAVTGGTYSGNVATITMPSAVYAIPGAISVAVKITLDSVVTTIAAFAATVYATSTDTAIDPGTIIPSIQTLIAEIEAAVDSIPADYSSLWATLAPNYSNLTFPVAVGQYCTYNGGFYRCNTAIATQEAWTAAHWTATNIGADLAETRLDVANLEDDVSELKSAIGTVPTGKTVQGQIEELQTGKADMIVVTDSTPAAVMSFPDGADGQPMALQVAVDPVQDLHRYDYPWPAGGGKNLLPMTVEGIKAKNTDGTWNGNAYTFAGITYTLLTDADDNVIGIKANGTSSIDYPNLYLPVPTIKAGTYTISGSPNKAGFIIYYSGDFKVGLNQPSMTKTFAEETTLSDIRLCVMDKATESNDVFYPQIESGSSATTFAPYSNICPISGWTGAKVTRTGKNLFDKSGLIAGIIDNNGSYVSNNSYRCSPYIYLKAGTYIASRNNAPDWWKLYKYKNNNAKTPIGFIFNAASTLIHTFTLIEDSYVRFGFNYIPSSGDNIQLEINSAVTVFEPYAWHEYSITFPSEAGTVYGGTLTLNQDGTGSLVVDRAKKKVSDLSFSKHGTEAGNIYYSSSIQSVIKRPADNYSILEKLSASEYKTGAWENAFTIGQNNNTVFVATSGLIGIKDDAIATLSDFTTIRADVEIVYPLATPVTYTLTAPQVKTLLGVNNIWADTGDILSVDYPADTKLYVDQRIAEKVSASQRLMELIVTANREDTMKATKAYSSGDLLIVNGTLYKATTSIANGATLTVGTNVTETNIGAELALLA